MLAIVGLLLCSSFMIYLSVSYLQVLWRKVVASRYLAGCFDDLP